MAAADAEVSAQLAAAGEPCFERIDAEAQRLGGCRGGARVGRAAPMQGGARARRGGAGAVRAPGPSRAPPPDSPGRRRLCTTAGGGVLTPPPPRSPAPPPCAPCAGLEWGQEGWRRMTLAKVFLLDAIVDWGFNHVISDVDVVRALLAPPPRQCRPASPAAAADAAAARPAAPPPCCCRAAAACCCRCRRVGGHARVPRLAAECRRGGWPAAAATARLAPLPHTAGVVQGPSASV